MTLHQKIDLVFLFLLLPFFILGVAETNYLIGTYLLYFIIIRNRSLYESIINHQHFAKIFLSFYFILIISSFLSEYTYFSLKSSLLFFFYLIYIFSILIIFQSNKKIEIYFLIFGTFLLLIISIDGFYELFFKKNIFGFYGQTGRVAGLFHDRWVIGTYILKLLPLFVGIYLINKDIFKKFQHYLFLIFFSVSSLMIVFSGERKAYLLFIFYLFLMFIYILRYISVKKLLIFFAIMFFFISSPFLFSNSSERIKHQLMHHISNFDYFENQYYALYTTSFKMFLDNPLIGVGPNVFRKKCFDREYVVSFYSCSTHPHNFILQLLSEIGLIGFCFFYSIYIYFLIKLFKIVKKKKFSNYDFGLYSIICSIIVNFWPIIPSPNFFLSWNGFLSLIPFSLYLYYINIKRINDNK